jgi:serine O-acetyltransferase
MAEPTLAEVALALSAAQSEPCAPSGLRRSAEALVTDLLAVMFPHFAERSRNQPEDMERHLHHLADRIDSLAKEAGCAKADAGEPIGLPMIQAIPSVRAALLYDADAILDGDPAAHDRDEVILAYPGFLAVAVHRLAHRLHALGVALVPRLFSEWAHRETGIDIHPGAHIGPHFFIDHGTGVVIGETAVIGRRVKLYQGVTLGALVVEKRLSGAKRHPTLENNVVVYANATILGGKTVIGHDTVVGGNAWITESVPPFSIVGRDSEVRPRRSDPDPQIEYFI